MGDEAGQRRERVRRPVGNRGRSAQPRSHPTAVRSSASPPYAVCGLVAQADGNEADKCQDDERGEDC